MTSKTITLLMMFVLSNYLVSAQGMRVAPGTSIKVETGTTLDITTGNLILESSAAGDASLIDLGVVEYNNGGQANVQRYRTNVSWHLVSSPITNALSGMFEGDYLQIHSELTNLYTDVASTTYQLVPMKGYSLWSVEASPTTEVFAGTTNTGNQVFSFAKSGAGYNLMGNPYPSAIDWDAVTIPVNLNGSFYLWDPTTGAYKYYLEGAGGGNTTTKYIPSGQGFFTQATGSGTLTLGNSVRTQGTQAFYKETEAQIMLVLKVTGNDITTQTAIRFIGEATPLVDRLFDVPAIISGYPDVPNLYSFAEGREMAINTLPAIQDYEIVPVTFQAGKAGNYTILAAELGSFPAEVPVYLEDVERNYFQDLRANPEYSFDYQAPEAKAFKVHFKDVTGIETPEAGAKLAVNCFLTNDVLHVNFLNNQANNQNATLKVYSITGQQMLSRQLSQTNNEIPFHASQTIYIVNITTNEANFSTKVSNR
jgi:hypothetical protein